MNSNDSFIYQVREASVPIYLKTQSELLEYYETSGNGGRSKLYEELASIAKISKASVARRFQGSRGKSGKVTPKVQDEYRQLGELIGEQGYKTPPGGFTVTFVGQIRISNQCYPRHFHLTISGPEAQELLQAMESDDSEEMWRIIFQEYFEDDPGEDTADGPCGDPSITVKAA